MTSTVVELHSYDKVKTTLKLDFQFDSLTLVLYIPNSSQVRKIKFSLKISIILLFCFLYSPTEKYKTCLLK